MRFIHPCDSLEVESGFIPVPEELVCADKLKSSSLILYMHLMRTYEESLGYSQPSYKYLSQKTGFSVNTISSAIADLKQLCLIEQVATKEESGSPGVFKYFFPAREYWINNIQQLTTHDIESDYRGGEYEVR